MKLSNTGGNSGEAVDGLPNRLPIDAPLQPLPIDAPLSSRPGVLDHAVWNLRASFPDSLLLPVPWGVDPRDVHPPSITEVDSPGYLAQLGKNNIAVPLGHPP